jgi:hypothetical protein
MYNALFDIYHTHVGSEKSAGEIPLPIATVGRRIDLVQAAKRLRFHHTQFFLCGPNKISDYSRKKQIFELIIDICRLNSHLSQKSTNAQTGSHKIQSPKSLQNAQNVN